MLTPRLFLYISVVLVLFWLSCVIFGIKANIDRSEASRSQSRTRKNHPKKKKSLTIVFSPPESCLCHFSTWSKKVVIQLCFPLPKKKGDPRKTHHSPAANTHKINTHRHGTQQPPAAAKPNTSPHSPATKTQHLTLD